MLVKCVDREWRQSSQLFHLYSCFSQNMATEDTPVFLRKLSIPRPSSGYLRGLAEPDRPIAVFSDFDGTIFLQDTGHVLFDKFGCGRERREQIDSSIGKTRSFRDASEELWSSLNVTLSEAIATLKKELVIDPDFYTFFEYLQMHHVPFTVISAGIRPLLRTALDEFLGPENSAKIEIVSNDGEISEDGKTWKVKWRHDSPLGHDKAKSVQEFRSRVKDIQPRIVFIGDGVSDLAAASQADILFARRGLALEHFCIENRIPYIPYDRFKDVIQDIKYLIVGNRFHDEVAAEEYKRARVAKLTGGLAPLTPATNAVPKPIGFEVGGSDDEEEDDDEKSVSASPPHSPRAVPPAKSPPRPRSPLQDPNMIPLRPGLARHYSVGDSPEQKLEKKQSKLAPTQE